MPSFHPSVVRRGVTHTHTLVTTFSGVLDRLRWIASGVRFWIVHTDILSLVFDVWRLCHFVINFVVVKLLEKKLPNSHGSGALPICGISVKCDPASFSLSLFAKFLSHHGGSSADLHWDRTTAHTDAASGRSQCTGRPATRDQSHGRGRPGGHVGYECLVHAAPGSRASCSDGCSPVNGPVECRHATRTRLWDCAPSRHPQAPRFEAVEP